MSRPFESGWGRGSSGWSGRNNNALSDLGSKSAAKRATQKAETVVVDFRETFRQAIIPSKAVEAYFGDKEFTYTYMLEPDDTSRERHRLDANWCGLRPGGLQVREIFAGKGVEERHLLRVAERQEDGGIEYSIYQFDGENFARLDPPEPEY